MTVPASGNITLRQIIEEIYGVGYVGSKDLIACAVDSDPVVAGGAAPVDIRDFAGHTQNWGRVYSDLTISYTAYIRRITQGSYYQVVSGVTLRFTGDRNESVAVYQDTSATPIPSGTLTLELYRRTKQTAGAWTLDTTFSNYTSTQFGLTLSLYDYQIKLVP